LENIFLGAEISRHGLLDYETMTLRCQKLLAQVNLPFHPIPASAISALGNSSWLKLPKRSISRCGY
jgi:D-xylose transport system ATP-binding protein